MVYSCAESRLFDTEQFEMWFFKQFVSLMSNLVGPIVLIGDNLGSHFSIFHFSRKFFNIVTKMKSNFYVCHLIQHVCQQIEQCDILDTWRKESQCSDNLLKTIFLSLLYKLFCHLMICYQRTREVKNQHLQNRKQERKKVSRKVDEDENDDVQICNNCEEEWDDNGQKLLEFL